MTLFRSILLPLFVSCTFNPAVFGQWTADSSANTPVATGSENQIDVSIVADGSGGVIMAWREFSAVTGYDVIAQRVDTLGVPLWPGGGAAVCTTSGDVADLRLAADGRGGAVFVWREIRGDSGWDLWGQRIDSNGVLQWAAGGVPVCTAANTQDEPQIDGDGTGGAIVAWRDMRNGTDRNIYAQRIDSSGIPLWTAGGVSVCGTGEDQNGPQLARDGMGGAVIAWEDLRSSTNFDIYAQRIGAAGSPAWTPDGLPISIAVHDQINPRVAGDGAGRTIIAWEDARNGTSWDIYAQRVNDSGILMWNPAAEAVCTSSLNQGTIDISDDGSGGAFIVWQDDRNVLSTDIYAQHLNNFGGSLWGSNGVPACTAPNHQFFPHVARDGTGGAYVIWHDLRKGSEYDIFAQRINAAGSAAWPSGGVDVCVAAGNQLDPVIVSDGATGAIAAWKDGRPGSDNDIYAQNMLPDGTLGLYPWVLATAGPHGSVSPAGTTAVPWGGSLEVIITPATGYHVDSVYVNGGYVGAPASYTFDDVASNMTIHAVFTINVYTIIATAGAHGSITQPGATQVVYGQTQAYGITPDPGYEVGLVMVDGAAIPDTTYYIFMNITSDHTIGAWFGNDSTSILPVNARWNIVSVPSVPSDYSKPVLFPTAGTAAYYFDGSYQQADTLQNGPGYWLKFDSAQVVTLAGAPLTIDTFDVAEGWNMIGSISDEVPVGVIESVPPGIVTSQFFAYSTGYVTASAIRPGSGYWVKASQAGQLVLSSAPSASPANRIRIAPTEDSPPPPPDDGSAAGPPPTATPLPAEFGLDQNFPNPFNPSTVIGFRLPAGSDIQLVIYSLTGERIALVADGYRGAGSYRVTWDAGGYPAGVYFCRLRAGSFTANQKIILLK